MRPSKALAALVKDEPLNVEERMERLEQATGRKLQQFEEALGVFKDLVVKLYEENEKLKSENASLKSSITQAASQVKDAVIKPLANAGEEFVELLMENDVKPDGPKVIGNVNHVGFSPNTEEMERTIEWMREKFGLPPKMEAKRTKKKRK